MGPTDTQTEAAHGGREEASSDVDLNRIQRGMRNLAFKLEQDQQSRQSELSSIREQLDELRARFDELGTPEHSSNGAPSRSSTVEAAAPSDRATRELKALRRQVSELQRAVGELRRTELGRRGRSGPLRKRNSAEGGEVDRGPN